MAQPRKAGLHRLALLALMFLLVGCTMAATIDQEMLRSHLPTISFDLSGNYHHERSPLALFPSPTMSNELIPAIGSLGDAVEPIYRMRQDVAFNLRFSIIWDAVS